MRKAGIKLTKITVDAAKPTMSRYVIWDNAIPGFGIRVAPSGVKTLILRYRPKGSQAPKRFLTLGRFGTTTVDEARSRATKILGLVADGQDPAAKLNEGLRALTVKECANLFLSQHVLPKRKPNTVSLYQHLVNSRIEPALGKKRLVDVTKIDVAKFHHSMKDTPYIANRAVTTLAAIYSWAVNQGYVPEGTNPAKKLELFRENHRERFLTSDEFSRLGQTLRLAETAGLPYHVDETRPKSKHAKKIENRITVISPHATAAIRLLVLTGCRLREILDLRWEQIDFGRGLLFLPDSKTGKKTVLIAARAVQILEELPRVGSYVIVGNRADQPLSGLKRPWKAIRKHAKIDGVRLHDLRHTFASVGAGSGLGLPIIGKLLGHKQSRTTARYAHLADDPLRQASESVSAKIAEAIGEGKREGD